MSQISAIFTGDFSRFNDAVEKAGVVLKTFEHDVQKVGTGLSKFGNQFSGQKVVQDALLMERAIQEVGGVSKLTADELKRAAAATQLAIDKMNLMGGTIPPKIRNLAADIKAVEKNTTLAGRAADFAKSTFGQMFGAFTAVNLVDKAVGSLINFGKAAFDTAGRINDLSERTGLSTDAVQEFQFVAEQTGTSLDTFATASLKLGINLSKTGDEAKKAKADVAALGLSWKGLQGATQEEQLKQVLDALGKMEDLNKRNRLGVELLGKGWLELGPAAQAGVRDMTAQASKIEEAQVKALAEAGDAWDKFVSDTGNAFTNMIGTMILDLQRWKREVADRGDLDYQGYDTFKPPLPKPGDSDFIGPVMGPKKPPPKPLALDDGGDIDSELKRLLDAQAKLREGFFGNAIKEAQDFAAALGSVKKLDLGSPEQIRKALALMTAANEEAKRLGTDAGPAVARFTAELQKLATLPSTMPFHMSMFTALPPAVNAAAASIDGRLLPAFNRIASVPLDDITNGLYKLPSVIGMINQQVSKKPPGEGFFGGLKGGLDSVFKGLGGGEGKGFGGILNKLGGGIVEGFGSIISGGISSVIGMGVSLATKGLAALGSKLFKSEGKQTNKDRDKWIKDNFGSQDDLIKIAKQAGITDAALHKLFTIGKVKDFEAAAADVQKTIEQFTNIRDENLAANKTRDAWIIKTAGGAEQLRALALQAGVTEEQLDKLFNTTKVEDFEAAAEEVDAVLGRFADEQAADAKRVEEAITKYGLAWDELGSQLQQKKLDSQAKELIEDWRVLIEAGVDLAKVNAKMSDDVEDFLEKAKATGAEIPAAMRPMLEKMIEQGVLTDASGKKIEKLEDLGVTFAQTMTQGFDRIVEKLNDLIKKMGATGTALDNIPDRKDVEIHYHHIHHGSPGGGGDENGDEQNDAGTQSVRTPLSFLDPESMPGFARGTGGRYLDFGSGTPAMLHGKERIITPLESQTAADALSGMVNAVAGLQVTLVRAIRENALQLRDQALLARG